MSKKQTVKPKASLGLPLALGTLQFTLDINNAPKKLRLSVSKKKENDNETDVRVKGNNSDWVKELDFFTVDLPNEQEPAQRVYKIQNLVVEEHAFEKPGGLKEILISGKLTITIKTG